MNFRELIGREAGVLRKLHEDIHFHFARAPKDGRGPAAKGNPHGRLWREACARFHAHVSPLDDWFEAGLDGRIGHDPETLDFVLTFLELDPMFFRSGYVKEALLRRLTRVSLGRDARKRVDAILLDAVRRRGTREFRRYCRLAAKAGSPGLREDIEALASEQDKAVASRARMMLRYMADEKVQVK